MFTKDNMSTKSFTQKKLMITQEGVSEAPNQSNPVTGYYGN